jgi:hypothetical protein
MSLDYRETDYLQENASGYEADISTQFLAIGCAICGTILRDPMSLERGWGPICDDYYMGGSGTSRVDAKMLTDFDEAEAEAAIAEAPNAKPETWMEPSKIQKVYKKGDTLPDGTFVEKGWVVETKAKQLKVPGLRDYWERKGGNATDPDAAWRTDPETRRLMVSNGIWYASRAAYSGYPQHVVSADKVDPRWVVIAAVQRFARAVGLSAAADRMTNFYTVKVKKDREEAIKAAKREAKAKKKSVQERARIGAKAVVSANSKLSVIVFEQVPTGVQIGNPGYKTSAPEGTFRVSGPSNDAFNRAAKENRDIFFTYERDWPYFWRYFNHKHLRQVINIVQGVYDDTPSVFRSMMTAKERDEALDRFKNQALVLDTDTGESRWFPKDVAKKLTKHYRYQKLSVKK